MLGQKYTHNHFQWQLLGRTKICCIKTLSQEEGVVLSYYHHITPHY